MDKESWMGTSFLKVCWCCLLKKLSKLVRACRNFRLPNLARFIATQCIFRAASVIPSDTHIAAFGCRSLYSFLIYQNSRGRRKNWSAKVPDGSIYTSG